MKNKTVSKDSVQIANVHSVRGMLQTIFQKYSMYIFLIFIMIIFQVLTDGVLLRPLNLTNVILQNSYILILAIGMVMLIILGDIDLSVGSIAAFIGALFCYFDYKYEHTNHISYLYLSDNWSGHRCIPWLLGSICKSSSIHCYTCRYVDI